MHNFPRRRSVAVRTAAISLLLLAFATLPSRVPAADDTEEKRPAPVLRSYDVAELVLRPTADAESSAILPPTELTSGSRSKAGNAPQAFGSRSAAKGQSDDEPLDRLIKLIITMIDPTSWRDSGGTEANIYAFENRLIISAIPENHRQIADLLDDLRRTTNRNVRIRATWLLLSDEELQSVTAPPQSGVPDTGPRTVDPAALDRLKDSIRYRGEVNVLNGVRVNLTAGRARSTLSGLSAVVGNGAAALEPTIDLVLAGVTLQVTPVLSADAASVLLDLRAAAGQWDRPDAPPMKIPQPVASTQPATSPSPAAPPLKVDRLNMPVHHVATAVKIPTNRPILIAGMTQHADGDPRRQMYLILEVSAPPPDPTSRPVSSGSATKPR
jgi:hypothetical protein